MEKKKGWWILSIIAIAIVILCGVILSNTQKQSNNTTTSVNIKTGKENKTDKNELKKNIKIEALGIATNGDFVFKVNNANDQPVFLNTINIIFKDKDGNFMEKAESESQFFGIKANSELILYSSGYEKDFSKYSNHEFEFELSSDYMSKDIIIDNFEIIANNTGEQIAVQLKNNNDIEVKNTHILVVYYKSGKVVGCIDGFEFDTNTKANETTYINVGYPEDSRYKTIEFDDYKTYLIKSEKIY